MHLETAANSLCQPASSKLFSRSFFFSIFELEGKILMTGRTGNSEFFPLDLRVSLAFGLGNIEGLTRGGVSHIKWPGVLIVPFRG